MKHLSHCLLAALLGIALLTALIPALSEDAVVTAPVDALVEEQSVALNGGPEEAPVVANDDIFAVDAAHFPDPILLNYVAEAFDRDGSGGLSQDEIDDWATGITLTDKGVASLRGIEYFPNLKSLHCSGNYLTELDISHNPKLEYIECSDNQLTVLDASNCPAIEQLHCNGNQLTTLKLGPSTVLDYVSCMANRLTALDVSANTGLNYLRCYGNSIQNLDITNCPGLVDAYTQGELSAPASGFYDVLCISYNYNNSRSWLSVDAGQKITVQGYEAPTEPDPTEPDPTEPDPTAPDPTAPDPDPTSAEWLLTSASKTASKEVYLGEAFQIRVTDAAVVSYKPTSSKVVSISDTGFVTTLKAGTTSIVIKLDNKVTLRVKLAVLDPRVPQSVVIFPGSGPYYVDTMYTFEAKVLPETAEGTQLTWKSSNKKVATIDEKGTITPLATGKTTISVKTKNNKGAKCEIEFVENPNSSRPVCRALLIGNITFTAGETLKDAKNDVQNMAKMLKKCKGPGGGSWTVYANYDQSAEGIHSLINACFHDARLTDVSLFFISTHGNDSVNATPEKDSCLAGYNEESFVTTRELAEWLGEVHGKVFVIIDACGSGGFIYENGAGARSPEDWADAFNRSVMDAFCDADPGLPSPEGIAANVGELRQENKFYVLTAARRHEPSHSSGSGGYFTKALIKGAGSFAADKPKTGGNKDNIVTFDELYKYIDATVSNKAIKAKNPDTGKSEKHYQHVQVFPANCNQEFVRK